MQSQLNIIIIITIQKPLIWVYIVHRIKKKPVALSKSSKLLNMYTFRSRMFIQLGWMLTKSNTLFNWFPLLYIHAHKIIDHCSVHQFTMLICEMSLNCDPINWKWDLPQTQGGTLAQAQTWCSYWRWLTVH